jgi:hypothetical protein
MVILNLTVYSGTACVSIGQAVKRGEVLVRAIHVIKEEEIKAPIFCVITAECVFEYIYTSNYPLNGDSNLNALASAKFALGDFTVRSYTTQKIGKNQIKVILKYEKTLNGG